MKKIVLMLDDFNVDLLTSDSNVNRKFLKNMLALGFLPSISLPTRVTTTIAVLLDNTFFLPFIQSSNTVCDIV